MRLRLPIIMATAILAIPAAGIGEAGAVPSLVNYQAYLTDNEGTPLSGPVNLEFAVYDSAAAGAVLWTEAHPGTVVEDGIFHAVLGGASPLDPGLFEQPSLWLETRLEGAPLVPRRQFLSVPYAFRAAVADVALNGGGDDTWTVNGDDIYRIDGKVGIGTGAPAERIHVADGLFARLRLERIGGASVQTDASLTTGSVGTLTAHPFRLLSNNSVRMSVGSDGLIGIGTTSPTATLQVNGGTSRAVYGLQQGSSGTLIGVWGESNSITGAGVRGQANHATGAAYGVLGQATGSGGTGVLGESIASSGATYGLLGRASSPDGFGIYAENTSPAGKAAYLDGDAVTVGIHSIQTGTATLNLTGDSASADQTLAIDSGDDMSLSSSGSLLAESAASTEIDAGTSLLLTSSTGTTLSSSTTTLISAGTFVRVSGNMGIGLNPGFQLHLSSNSAAKPTSNTWTVSSDRRLKKNIEPLQGALPTLMRLRGVTYEWKDPSTQGGMAGTYPGFIAQDVEPIFPDWIQEDANGYKTLTVIGFEALAVEAMRELREEKDREIAALRDRMRMLEERLEMIAGAAEARPAGPVAMQTNGD